jgi:sulfite exporter TauE/SafE/plastocyanin domain-containing protein/copper chaperone CopZ
MDPTTYRITFTKGGKRFVATVKATSQEEAIQKLNATLANEKSPTKEAPAAISSGKSLRLYVQGTHCASCEVLIERKFKKLPGVENVSVNYRTGEARVRLAGSAAPSLKDFENVLRDKGYRVHPWSGERKAPLMRQRLSDKDIREIGAAILLILGGFLALRRFHLLPAIPAFTEQMTYPFIFMVGLVAAGSSCLAVVGGLLLSLSSALSKAMEGQPRWKRFQPHLLFNVGRLASYALFGGIIGLLGKALSLTPHLSGILMLAAAAFMVLTALSILNIIPHNPLVWALPKRFQHAIHDASTTKKRGTSFLLGAATFFLPCGFTQSLQLYAVTTGSFEKGALTMLVFALGTMPALAGIGALSSFLKGKSYHYFLRFAGAFVLLLGIYNTNNGLTLLGFSPSAMAANLFRSPRTVASSSALDDPYVRYDGQKQVVSMEVNGLRYIPNHFTIRQGVPVEWNINGVNVGGCSQVLLIPTYGIVKYLRPGPVNTITFTPTEPGEVPFHCSMGMVSGSFTVLPNGNAPPSSDGTEKGAPAPSGGAPSGRTGALPCDPSKRGCTIQTVTMEISRERGFYPREFTVKKGIPVDFRIDAKVVPGGCGSILVIPEYNIAHQFTLGENHIFFTPTKEGVLPFTCSMGSTMGHFIVES